jgi:hypothetical protein
MFYTFAKSGVDATTAAAVIVSTLMSLMIIIDHHQIKSVCSFSLSCSACKLESCCKNKKDDLQI